MLEQEIKALVREQQHTFRDAERLHRIVQEPRLELAILSIAHAEDKANTIRAVLQNTNQLALDASAQLTSVASHATRHINQPQQEHISDISAVKSREQQTSFRQIEAYEQDAQIHIHHKGEHSTSPTWTLGNNK